jgi:hypothetical protein
VIDTVSSLLRADRPVYRPARSSIAPLSVDLATIHAQEELSSPDTGQGTAWILHIDETTHQRCRKPPLKMPGRDLGLLPLSSSSVTVAKLKQRWTSCLVLRGHCASSCPFYPCISWARTCFIVRDKAHSGVLDGIRTTWTGCLEGRSNLRRVTWTKRPAQC